MKQMPIGVFDSGLGGLTVAREIARCLPTESLVYLGDTARCPYGPRDLAEVRRFVLEIGSWLERRPVKLIVIACNTATAAGLALAQRAFSVPVIGVVEPGARAAVMATRNRRVGVIGTVGTIESGAYSRAVRALDAGVTVFSAATPRFVEIVEEGLRLDAGPVEGLLADSANVFIRPSFHQIARDYLDPLKRSGIDTLVLGCTHYPLLSASIQQVVGAGVQLISSAEETAHEVAETLARRGQLVPEGAVPRCEFFTTGDTSEFERLGSRVFGGKLPEVTAVALSDLAQVPASMLGLIDDPSTREASCA
jgi:glutamate racemase